MIKKISYISFLLFFLSLVLFILTLSITGIKTDKFNNLIVNKISKNNIQLDLKSIYFKLDPKKLSLFLETPFPNISYKNFKIPTKKVKVYVDFLPLLKADLKVKNIYLALNELNYAQLNELSKFIKPSNFKSFINNKIKEVKLNSDIEIFFDKNGEVEDYIIKGKVQTLKVDLFKDIKLSKINLSFFADKEDILIKNIFGNIDDIKINDGDIKLNLENGIKLNSNFNSNINLNSKNNKKFNDLLEKLKLKLEIKELNGNFITNIFVKFNETYKLLDYYYEVSGKVNKSKIELFDSIKNDIVKSEIKDIYFLETQVDLKATKDNLKIDTSGKYSFNNVDFLQLKIDCNLKSDLLQLNANFDYKNNFDLKIINYNKPKERIANISLEFEKNKNISNIKKLNFKEKNNSININNLKFKDNNFVSLKTADISTKNNNFSIQWDKKIMIKGSSFDATNLPKLLNKKDKKNTFKNINTNIEIDFINIQAPLSEKLENFRLIGEIKKGKFIKISSKGDFGGSNFLDISLKKDNNSEKRFLEIYSDLTRPLLTEYSFFKGLIGGKLLYTSLIDGSKSNSKLKIENFKVVNAPGVIKLLSLADLGGLVDLAEGEGLSFDVLEIDMEKDKNLLQINEILALGPSMSVLIEGYQDNTGLTSLKGTLVPAKTLNKMISKIPIIGNIVIPKDIGEGLFGISFKMKGPKGNVKTTINPIRTLTPRFIQKIVDKNKFSK